MTDVRVVISDDDAAMRSALEAFLGGEPGIAVVATADDAAGAIAVCIENQPDVVLLDVRMPGGGVSAAQTLRKVCPSVAIIALTAYGDDTTRTEMLEAGAAAFLVKGDDPDALVAAILDAAPRRL